MLQMPLATPVTTLVLLFTVAVPVLSLLHVNEVETMKPFESNAVANNGMAEPAVGMCKHFGMEG